MNTPSLNPTANSSGPWVDGRMVTEASGGITLVNLGEIAAAGVDIVSLGWLTHSAPILDIALDLDPITPRVTQAGTRIPVGAS